MFLFNGDVFVYETKRISHMESLPPVLYCILISTFEWFIISRYHINALILVNTIFSVSNNGNWVTYYFATTRYLLLESWLNSLSVPLPSELLNYGGIILSILLEHWLPHHDAFLVTYFRRRVYIPNDTNHSVIPRYYTVVLTNSNEPILLLDLVHACL